MAMEVSAQDFEREVLQQELPVLVDFWAPWCAPCRMVAPALEAVAKEFEGKLKVCKLNVDEAAEVASRYGVMSIPTLIIFNKGEVAQQTVGALPKERLVEFIQPVVKSE